MSPGAPRGISSNNFKSSAVYESNLLLRGNSLIFSNLGQVAAFHAP